MRQNAKQDFSIKDTAPCACYSLDSCLIYIPPLCFITFIVFSATLNQTALALLCSEIEQIVCASVWVIMFARLQITMVLQM